MISSSNSLNPKKSQTHKNTRFWYFNNFYSFIELFFLRMSVFGEIVPILFQLNNWMVVRSFTGSLFLSLCN